MHETPRDARVPDPLEPVVVDPASNWPLFAEKARELLQKEKVAAVFGCWTSVSRKSVLPVFEELNGILFYPVQYEGEESSRNVFYTGAAPNQQAIPAVDYLMANEKVQRWVLAGTDYVYPRTTNKILRAFLKSKGVADKDIDEKYTPFGHSDYQTIVAIDDRRYVLDGQEVSSLSSDERARVRLANAAGAGSARAKRKLAHRLAQRERVRKRKLARRVAARRAKVHRILEMRRRHQEVCYRSHGKRVCHIPRPLVWVKGRHGRTTCRPRRR